MPVGVCVCVCVHANYPLIATVLSLTLLIAESLLLPLLLVSVWRVHRVCLNIPLFILVDINWPNRACQQWQTCTRHTTCSGLYMAQPSGNVLLKLLFSRARDAKDASSPADLPCLRLFRLFIYLSFSLTAFCLQENDRLSLPLCFVASFFICNSLSLTLILAYSFPSFSCHSSQLPSAMCFLPSGTELHLHHLSLFFCKRMALFYIASDRLSHRQSSPLHK